MLSGSGPHQLQNEASSVVSIDRSHFYDKVLWSLGTLVPSMVKIQGSISIRNGQK